MTSSAIIEKIIDGDYEWQADSPDSWRLFVGGESTDERVCKKGVFWFHRDPNRPFKSFDLDEIRMLAIEEIVQPRDIG